MGRLRSTSFLQAANCMDKWVVVVTGGSESGLISQSTCFTMEKNFVWPPWYGVLQWQNCVGPIRKFSWSALIGHFLGGQGQNGTNLQHIVDSVPYNMGHEKTIFRVLATIWHKLGCPGSWSAFYFGFMKLSTTIYWPAFFCICENKGKDQHLCFCYMYSTISLLPKSQFFSL